MAKSIVFIDTEVGVDDHKIHDIGAVRQDRAYFHSASVRNFVEFIAGAEYICGHNILHHDLKYIHDSLGYELRVTVIDTLYLSPLLFPKRPYHALLKDDKLQTEQLNDPVNDCQKAASLFYDEVNAFFDLPPKVKQIFCCLLYDHPEFSGFFQYVNFRPYKAKIYELIHMEYEGRICTNADLLPLIRHYPVELAYALALIGANDEHSITPPWLLKNYPKIENVIKYLRGTPCANGCTYCHNALDIHRELKRIFGYDSFRTYNGEPLQEKAAQAAVDGKSVLAVFPTGGGKSITFQLPALMAGKAVHGLTVVISPLQSLMKDQVDNLNAIGINEAVTVNGLLDPIERANALESGWQMVRQRFSTYPQNNCAQEPSKSCWYLEMLHGSLLTKLTASQLGDRISVLTTYILVILSVNCKNRKRTKGQFQYLALLQLQSKKSSAISVVISNVS